MPLAAVKAACLAMTANARLVVMIFQFVSGVTLETNGSFSEASYQPRCGKQAVAWGPKLTFALLRATMRYEGG